MHSQEAINQFLEAIGAQAGAGLTLDHEGVCMIENDEGVECEITALPESDRFLLTSLVGETIDADNGEFYAGLLTINSDIGQLFGATIGLDPASGLLMLHQMHSVRGLDQEGFENLIGEFYALSERLTQAIQTRDFHGADQTNIHAADRTTGEAPTEEAEDASTTSRREEMRWHRI